MKQNDILLIGALAVVAVGAVIYLNKEKDEPQVIDDIDVQEPEIVPSPEPVNLVAPLNLNLLLKQGSKGREVQELQKLLGTTTDGNFGPITENLLNARKGVKQITLTQFKTRPDVPKNSLVKGDKVMANKKPVVKVFQNKTLANGAYSNTGILEDEYEYGEAIGTIVAVTNDKLHYVVRDNDTFSPDLVWVKSSEVSKI